MWSQEVAVINQEVDGTSHGLQGVLNTLSIGVIVLSCRGEVEFANREAKKIIRKKTWLRVVDQRLRCRPEENADLDDRIRAATENRVEASDYFLHLTGTENRDALLFAFSSLASSDTTEQPVANGVACIVVDPNSDSRTDVGLLKRLYSLTDAEANIAAFLANGLDYSEIAQHRGVTISTVRTYTKSIFKKLCVNCRAGVVRKVYAATIPFSLGV